MKKSKKKQQQNPLFLTSFYREKKSGNKMVGKTYKGIEKPYIGTLMGPQVIVNEPFLVETAKINGTQYLLNPRQVTKLGDIFVFENNIIKTKVHPFVTFEVNDGLFTMEQNGQIYIKECALTSNIEEILLGRAASYQEALSFCLFQGLSFQTNYLFYAAIRIVMKSQILEKQMLLKE